MTQLEPNEAAASLAFATHLSDGIAMHHAEQSGQKGQENPQEQAQEGSQTPETAPETAEKPTTPQDNQPTDMEAKFNQFEADIKNQIKQEIGGLKDTIKQALQDDEQEDKTPKTA